MSYYTVKEVAKMFKVREDTIWTWIRTGKLNALRTPGGSIRISQEAIDKAMTPVRY